MILKYFCLFFAHLLGKQHKAGQGNKNFNFNQRQLSQVRVKILPFTIREIYI